MKTRTDIENEYNDYKVEQKEVNSLEDFIVFIEVMQYDLIENSNITKREIKDNKKGKIIVKLRNYFLALIGESEIDVYDEDTDILLDIARVDEEYNSFLEKILRLATENNFKELLKLVEFTSNYYNRYVEFVDKQREMLELELRGIHLISPTMGIDSDEIAEFIEKKLIEIEGNIIGGSKEYVKG